MVYDDKSAVSYQTGTPNFWEQLNKNRLNGWRQEILPAHSPWLDNDIINQPHRQWKATFLSGQAGNTN